MSLNLAAGHTYRVAVQAHADQDTQSAVKYSESFKPTLAQETDARVVYAGKWSASTASAASGSKIKISNTGNAKATLTATGKRFSWIASRGPDRGSARVYVDGAQKATMNTYLASASAQRIEYSINFTKSGTHTIAIVNLGSAGHPRVDVDAFLISS